jgi:Tol biopolymer transport system component
MKAKSFVLAGGVLVGAIILGCGGGGGGVSGTSDFIYYVDNGVNIIRQDFPTGNPFTSGSGTFMSEVRLSPDKSQLLFVNSNQLYVVNTNGTGLTTLTGYHMGDWNSDGSKVFAVSTTGNKIRSMNPDGTGVSGDLFDGNAGGGILSIDMNDQGTKMGITYVPVGWARIYTLNLDGTGLFAVTADGANSGNARWQPDGSSFVYERGGDIRTIEADGTGDAALAATAATEEQPSFRDNNTIVYISDGDIWQMAADGTGQVELFDGTNPLSWPESKG